MSFPLLPSQSFWSSKECCGYVAALVSIVAFGSFAVPIKCQAARRVEVDAMVLQSYKIMATLATCWVAWLVEDDVQISPWGLVSGLFMVPGGTAGYYGVQQAGLATAQGIWCSLKVIVAFAWGLLVFGEPVRSLMGTMASIGLMVAGLCGMSYFSAASFGDTQNSETSENGSITPETPLLEQSSTMDSTGEDDEDYDSLTNGEASSYGNGSEDYQYHALETGEDNLQPLRIRMLKKGTNSSPPNSQQAPAETSSTSNNEEEESPNVDMDGNEIVLLATEDGEDSKTTNRLWGILGASIDGIYGGSVMVPLHYAHNSQGLAFLPSFAIGCSTILMLAWIVRWYWASRQTGGSWYRAWHQLPSLHITTVGPYAILAGLIWSVGNVACILSVQFLGQGLGYSIVQSQLLIAGLWGVVYYKEIDNSSQIRLWFVSALVTVIGIVILSQQHIPLKMEEDAEAPNQDF